MPQLPNPLLLDQLVTLQEDTEDFGSQMLMPSKKDIGELQLQAMLAVRSSLSSLRAIQKLELQPCI